MSNNEQFLFKRNKETKNQIVFIDVEATGTDYEKDQITLITACKNINNEVTTLCKYIKLDGYSRLSNEIQLITDISYEQLEKYGVNLREALSELINFIGNSYIVSCNTQFVVQFIERDIKQVLGIEHTYSYIDIRYITKNIFPEMTQATFNDIINVLKIENDYPSDASNPLYFVTTQAKCFDAIIDLVKSKKLESEPLLELMSIVNSN